VKQELNVILSLNVAAQITALIHQQQNILTLQLIWKL
jgi:hypothetical protein